MRIIRKRLLWVSGVKSHPGALPDDLGRFPVVPTESLSLRERPVARGR